ncbi:hypothetical protein TrVFT333_000401 [Trichoderma virens FT-333]|nr:hypothetical protein TrVFT333_000401 [Trichoderma virens FT-333]
MGASDSKIGFKQGIFRLSEERNIAANDAYWTSFWELPESSEDVFSLFSPNDIRRTRDNALENIETLIQALTTRVFTLRHHPSFPDPDHAPERDILNCIRVLTRILPYLYEKESLGPWEEQFLWTPRRIKGRTPKAEVLFDEAQEGKEPVQSSAETNENLKPLAEELIDTLVDLLFFSDFTLPRQPNGQSKVTNEPSKQGVVRMCAFLLQTLSVEASFGSHLNKTFEGQESLPASIRINAFRGSYADFLLHSIYTLITTSQGNFAPVYPALLAIINNIAPHIEGLSASSGSQLMHLFSLMASPSFLLANETNHGLLHSLLDSINSILENKYRQNPELIMAIFKNKKRIEALRTFTLETGQEEIEKINRRRKDAGGHTGLFDDGSRRSSVDSVRSPSNTLSRTQSLEEVPEDSAFAVGDDDDDDSDEEPQPTPAASTASENPSQASSVTNVEDAVPQTTSVLPRQASARDAAADTLRRIQKIEFIGLEPSAIRVHSFEWSQLALGWYESLLWGVIFASEMQIAKGTMGIWNGTAIKLFRVQETAPAGPTLTSPRGAVDAVGSNIVSRIGQINLRGASAASNSAPNRGAS